MPGDDVVEYYRQRSNAGLILTEGVFICPLGSEWDHVPGIYTDEQVQGWKKVRPRFLGHTMQVVGTCEYLPALEE